MIARARTPLSLRSASLAVGRAAPWLALGLGIVAAGPSGIVSSPVWRWAPPSELGRAEHEETHRQIARIADAIRLYRANTRKYPNTLQDLVVRPSDANAWNGPYLESEGIPKDPWGNAFVYRPQSSRSGSFEITSYGADGVQGGDADNADISNDDTQRGNP